MEISSKKIPLESTEGFINSKFTPASKNPRLQKHHNTETHDECLKSQQRSVSTKSTEPTMFYGMIYSDFAKIMRFIGFDNKNQRSKRLRNDKFALICEVWYKLIESSQNCYKPGACLAIDDQLFPTKARCRFTQYMPNKPDNFRVKFWLASDLNPIKKY
uniref:DDE_Tnp_1_7 domain-containing protein n=1 Tax=Glossina austeni TaxID=7395 RepID=A0A1A9UGH5_GLOAU